LGIVYLEQNAVDGVRVIVGVLESALSRAVHTGLVKDEPTSAHGADACEYG